MTMPTDPIDESQYASLDDEGEMVEIDAMVRKVGRSHDPDEVRCILHDAGVPGLVREARTLRRRVMEAEAEAGAGVFAGGDPS